MRAAILCLFLAACASTPESPDHYAARHACEVEALSANAPIGLQTRLYKDCMHLRGMTP